MNLKASDWLGFLYTSRLKQKSCNLQADGKWVLITGATSGIGYITSLKYASMGTNIILLVRNPITGSKLKEKLERDYSILCKLYIADFEDLESVKKSAELIVEQNRVIDILINNAGAYRTKKRLLGNGVDSVFTVNHLAAFLITNILVKSLRNSDNPRVINVNSEGHRFGNVKINDLGFNKRLYSGLRSYGASKTAQLHCMYILKDILVKDNITINSMHPGAVRSNIGSHSGRLYNFYMNNVLKFFLKDPKISANALYYLGVSPDMLGVSGNFYNLTNKEIPAPHGQKSDFSMEVYNKSCELTGVGGVNDK